MLTALVVLPLLSAAVVGSFRNTWSKTMVSWVASGSVFATFAMTLVLFAQFLQTGVPIRATVTNLGPLMSNFGFVADSLSIWWMLVVTGCGFLIHLYSTGYMIDDPSYGRFMAQLNFFIFAMSLLVVSDNFVGLLIGWANVGLASYMLIGFYYKKPSATAAAMKAFIMNGIGEVGLVAGIAFIYKTYGTLSFDGVFAGIKAGTGNEVLNLIGVLLAVGAIAKSAQFPLHTWLPYAMEGPTPVSALIHAATMVTAGVYLVSRAWPIYQNAETAAALVAWVGGIGALFGAVVAAGQNDIKRVLAFSTLSQIGYMFMGNGLQAYVAADFHFLTHAFFKAALFLTAGIVIHHYAGDQDIRHMGGLYQKDKFAFWAFAIGALALIGIFPFAGFFSKDEILLAAMHKNMALFIIGILAAGVTAFYNVRLISLVFFGSPWAPAVKALAKKRASATRTDHGHDAHGSHGAQGHDHAHETPWAMKWSVGILAALSVVGGLIFFPHWQLTFLKPAFAGLELEPESINYLVAGVTLTMALVGGYLAWYLYGTNGVRRNAERDTSVRGGILVNMFYFDALYDFLVVKPLLATAGFVAAIGDGKVIDGIVDGFGRTAAAVGASLRQVQTGHIPRYAIYMFGGLVLMLAYFITLV